VLWPRERSYNTSAGSRLSFPTLETGSSVWVVQQPKVIGFCSDVQALTVRRCFGVTPVGMLAVEDGNILRCGNVGMAVGVSHERGGF